MTLTNPSQPSEESSRETDAISESELVTEQVTEKVISSEAPDQGQAPKNQSTNAWAIFTSTFITIFLAEIGDKTQVTTLLMTAESHHPWIVFMGAGSALVLTSWLGVWVGQWLAKRIQPRVLERSAGVSLLVIAALLIWEVVR
ncbi:MAG: TMEM165/GDT1 family protein [Microcoleaceae cyanobacterium]